MKNVVFKMLLLATVIVSPQLIQAAPVTQDQPNQLANPVFWMLLLMIIVLLVVIVGLSNSISQVVQYQRQQKKPGAAVKTILVLVLAGFSLNAGAQTEVIEVAPGPSVNPFSGLIYGMSPNLFWALITLMVFELVVIIVQVRILRGLLPEILFTEFFNIRLHRPSMSETCCFAAVTAFSSYSSPSSSRRYVSSTT